jgi:two-component system, OmpR family, KDP operon response regulator KdpE
MTPSFRSVRFVYRPALVERVSAFVSGCEKRTKNAKCASRFPYFGTATGETRAKRASGTLDARIHRSMREAQSLSRPLVLVVEDDVEMRRTLRFAFQSGGYDVLEAGTGKHALAKIREAAPNVMILDLGLPDIDGVDVAVDVRRCHEFPIVVLSARGDEDQQIRALDAGVDDYVTKPFRERELMARVRAALRRGPRIREYRELEVGDIRMDSVGRRVFVENDEVELTPIEFKLLHVLLSEAGRVVTHRQLLSEVWGPEAAGEVHYLRVFMRQLRAKIEEDAASPKRILTALGVGYRVAP